jgi:hypothetical protein
LTLGATRGPVCHTDTYLTEPSTDSPECPRIGRRCCPRLLSGHRHLSGRNTLASWTLAIPAQMLLDHVTVLASRCELDMAPRRRRLLPWWGSLRLWCGCLRLWCGSFLLSWRGLRLFCSRWRCRDGRHERLHRRWGHLWRRIRRDIPHGGWPDQCGEHRAVFARYRPALSVVCRHESDIGRWFLPRRCGDQV